jgi:hypothetical protein
MVSNLQDPKGVTANQASLREKILPAIKAAIVKLGGNISEAGGWVASQIGGVVTSATQMLSSIKSNPVLGLASGAIDWLGDKVKALGDWVQTGVKGVFDVAGQGVAKLSGFVEPVLGVLQKLAKLIGNIVKMLPDLVLGPVWALIPACIKDPIKDFIIKNILTEIPVIGTFVKIPNIWTKIQHLVLDFLAKVFVDGDLGGAALMVIRFVLEAVGVDVNLFLKVLGKAIGTLDEIMMHPMNFLKNIGSALVMGFQRFWDHIGANLLAGVQGWIFGALKGTGITPLKDLSVSSLFQLAMQVLGITTQKLRAKLEKAIGPKAMGVVDKGISIVTEAWHWITTLWNKGPAAVWEEVKERAADLGKSVMAGITKWIASDLIKIGIAKIAKLSNPAGEIIELIQTIMKTIDFVVTKMNRILAVADSVLDSIGAIVAGNLGGAAAGIEKALVSALSAVLTFLADWLGVSNPGEKIKEIVETIQAKVDVALDWLIAKAISIVQKLFGKGKDDKKDGNKDPKWLAAVAAVNAQLKTMEAATSDGKLTEEQIEAKLPVWKTTYGFTSLTVTPKGSVNEIMGAMSPPDVVADVPKAGPPKSGQPQFGGLDPNLGGVSMVIEPLTSDHEEGSDPGGTAPGVWNQVNAVTRDGVRLYVRGHLLNEKLGGKGEERNLTPITYRSNAAHERNVESKLKNALAPGSDRIFHYEVKAMPAAGFPTPLPKGVDPAETKLTRGFEATWYEMVPAGPDPQKPPFKRKDGGGESGSVTILNVPPLPHV